MEVKKSTQLNGRGASHDVVVALQPLSFSKRRVESSGALKVIGEGRRS